MKTYDDWTGDLGTYLQVGDLVDRDMAGYFTSVLPPATMNTSCIQMGEPYNHIEGKATYATLKNTLDGWQYCGHCFRGQTEEPKRETENCY